MTPLDAARLYISRGWCVVPIPAGRKAPAVEGWPNLRIGLDDAARHFAGGNIGVLLGPASGELADLDLDCAEAIALADLYLPATAAQFGRVSKPRAHRLYVCPGTMHETFADPTDGSMLLELRAGHGHQTVFPPSVHPSGEPIEWHGPTIAPVVITAPALRIAVAWLSVGCLIRRHVSVHASEHPGPDLVDLLEEVEPVLAAVARRWLQLDQRHDARTARLRPWRELTAADVELAEVVHAIPNACAWDGWNAMGLAIYAVTGGSEHGAVLFDDWSAKSMKYNPYVTADRWAHYRRSPPNRTGIGKLIALARQHGWRPRSTAHG